MSTQKGLAKRHVMKRIRERWAEFWEPTRGGRVPKDKQQQVTLSPQEVKGRLAVDTEGILVNLEVHVKRVKSNSLGKYQVEVNRS
jgi:hypothetical protein